MQTILMNFLFAELKDQLEEILSISDISPSHQQHDRRGLCIIKAYKKFRSEKLGTDGYLILLLRHAQSPFPDFGSYLGVVVGLDEDESDVFLKKLLSYFFTYEISRGIYINKDFSEDVYTMGDHEGTLQIICNVVSMKTKLILTRFGLKFDTLRFSEKSFLDASLGFTPYWDYKPTIAIHSDSVGVYTIGTFLKLNTMNKSQLNCNCIDGSVVNGLRQSILYSFVLDKPPGYKVFRQPQILHYRKRINKSVLMSITFYVEDDDNK